MEQPALLVVARIVDCPIWLFSDDNNAPIEIGDLMCGAPIEVYWRATGIGHFIPNAVQETAADALARHELMSNGGLKPRARRRPSVLSDMMIKVIGC